MILYIMQYSLLIILACGIFNIVRKKVKFGVLQLIFSIGLFVYNFIFVMHRDWVNTKQTEQDYFIQELMSLNIKSIIILFGYFALILFSIYAFTVKKHN